MFLEMIIVFMLKCKVVDLDDQWPMFQKSFWVDHVCSFFATFKKNWKSNYAKWKYVVHLIVDPQFYSTKFNMNIVHNTLQSIQMWQSKWPYYKIVNNMENNLNQESENHG